MSNLDVALRLRLETWKPGQVKSAANDLARLKASAEKVSFEKLAKSGGALGASLDRIRSTSTKLTIPARFGTELKTASLAGTKLAVSMERVDLGARRAASGVASLGRAGQQLRPAVAQAEALSRAMKRIEQTTGGKRGAAKALPAWAGAAAGAGLGAVGLGGAGAVLTGTAVATKGARDALTMERAMYDVARATDASGAELAAYQKSVVQLSVATGAAAPELANMLAAAGFAGRPKSELMAFTSYASKAMTAWGTTAEQTGDALAQIGNIYQANQRRIEEIGDAINTTADQSASKETDLMEVLRRVGAAGKEIGISAEQVLALGAALKEVGTAPEVASTALQALFQNLALGDAATKEFADGLKAIKMNSAQLQKGVRKDAMGAIITMLEKIKSLPDGLKRMEVLKQLFGREYADNMGALLNNVDGLKRLLNVVGKKENYIGSVNRDAEKKLQQDFNRIDRGLASLTEVGRRLGEPLKVAAAEVGLGAAALLKAFDALQEAKNKADVIAGKIARNEPLSEEDTATATSPDLVDKIVHGVANKREDQRNLDVQNSAEIARLETELAALERSIEVRRKAGATSDQTSYSERQVVAKRGELNRLRPPSLDARSPADATDRQTKGASETEARIAAERAAALEMARLEKLHRVSTGAAKRAFADKISELTRGEGGLSLSRNLPFQVPSDRPMPSSAPLSSRRPGDGADVTRVRTMFNELQKLQNLNLELVSPADKAKALQRIEELTRDIALALGQADLGPAAVEQMGKYIAAMGQQGDMAVAKVQEFMGRIKAEANITLTPTISPRLIAPSGGATPGSSGTPQKKASRSGGGIQIGQAHFHGVKDVAGMQRQLAAMADRRAKDSADNSLSDMDTGLA